MHLQLLFPASLLLASDLSHALTHNVLDVPCTTKSQRKSWAALTDAEKRAYLDAELCIMETPASSGVPGAITRWDELQRAHAVQGDYIHGVGAFLPFHRYYMTVHEVLLRKECGYTGPLPYWDEPADVSNLVGSPVFDVDLGFGGDGAGSTKCVATGPFANLTLHMKDDGSVSNYCLTRSLSTRSFASAVQTNVDACLTETTYVDAWECLESRPHSAGHGGVGGLMLNPLISPGDPTFFLHHTYLDKVFWEWQSLDLENRLTEIGGANTRGSGGNPPGFTSAESDEDLLTARADGDDGELITIQDEFTDYFGDGGSITTLQHTLWAANIVENVTIADVMDIGGNVVCAEYI